MKNYSEKKNIAIIIPAFSGGGAERTASKLSLYLPKDRYEKFIVVFDTGNMKYEYDGHLVNLGLKASHHFIGKCIIFFKRIVQLKKIKKQYHIQTSISFLNSANIVNVLSKAEDKIVLSIRNYQSKSSYTFYHKMHNYLVKIFYKRADVLVTVSNGVKEDLVKNYGIIEDKIQVIYNFFSLEEINNLSVQELSNEFKEIFQHPVIINMGRLTMQKGQWHLIRAFKKVKETIPDSRLIFLGQGELESYLKALVHDLGLKKEVYFLGFQENPFKFISKSKLFVFPSLYEGFPNALVEAMACGIPVISADCDSGPREILAPDTDLNIKTTKIEYGKYGILIPVLNGTYLKAKLPLTNEENVLANSILEIYSSGELWTKYAKRSLARAYDFQIKENILKYEKIID